ncbi:proteasome subunit beta type-7-like isoform X2 [Acropora palmata]|uniref:proteasome subunit beta type-7-like isoform X2 n=1 Tax=Acropora palmata TaxID=6131 RepID=UPI003DA187B0
MPYWRKWARNCPLREKLEQRFAGLSSRMVLFLGLIQEQQRILLLLIRIVPRFTTLLQIFIVVVLALLPIKSTSLSSSLPTSSSTFYWTSDGNLSEQGQVEVNAYGSPVAAQDIARGGEVLVATDENVVRMARIVTALRMLKQRLFRYQGYISAALVLGGVNLNGPTLHTVYPHGSTDKLPYVTMGYGSLAAMSVFESRCKPDMELDEAKKLVRDAIAAGIFNDLGSGSNVDLCIITKEGTEYLRPYDVANDKGVRQGRYSYKRGTTAVLTKDIKPIVVDVTETTGEAMEM